MAINTLACPLSDQKLLPRKQLICMKKFIAEASFEEQKNCYRVDSGHKIFHYPFAGKETSQLVHRHWHNVIIKKHFLQVSPLTLEGRLNHAAYIIPTMHHFLSRLKALRLIAEKSNKQQVFILSPILEDLTLCKQFLYWAKTGISLNLVSFHKLTSYFRSDACSCGFGGYNIYSGRTWRLKLPPNCVGCAHINTLEFITSMISI